METINKIAWWFIKAFVTFGIVAALLVGARTIYNRQLLDFTYSYEYAYICIPGAGLVEGRVDSWRDFEDGDQIQVNIEGTTYLTHIANVVLISE